MHATINLSSELANVIVKIMFVYDFAVDVWVLAVELSMAKADVTSLATQMIQHVVLLRMGHRSFDEM
jgi:hypothetical protein